MDILTITLIIVSVYFTLSLIIKGGLMLMYGYFMYDMFFKMDKEDEEDIDFRDNPDFDYDELPF